MYGSWFADISQCYVSLLFLKCWYWQYFWTPKEDRLLLNFSVNAVEYQILNFDCPQNLFAIVSAISALYAKESFSLFICHLENQPFIVNILFCWSHVAELPVELSKQKKFPISDAPLGVSSNLSKTLNGAHTCNPCWSWYQDSMWQPKFCDEQKGFLAFHYISNGIVFYAFTTFWPFCLEQNCVHSSGTAFAYSSNSCTRKASDNSLLSCSSQT